MIEAKGPGYAEALQRPFMEARLSEDWVKQATRQLGASEGRTLEWYFAEEKAADKAREIFNGNSKLRGRILIFTVPAEAP
jgi:hypothetical protein